METTQIQDGKLFITIPIPSVVFVLGTADCHNWIYPFLTSPAYCTTVVVSGAAGPETAPGIARIIKQTELDTDARAEAILAEAPDAVVVLPHQDSLVEDTALGQRLATISGLRVITTSIDAARCGTEKIYMKEAFDRLSIPTPSYFSHEQPEFRDGEMLFYPAYLKRSADHEGKGNLLVESRQDYVNAITEFLNGNLSAYFEELVEGEELSVVVAGTPGSICVLPPVYKGIACAGADHPARRIRFCSPDHRAVEDAEQLYRYGEAIIEHFGTGGLIEVEAVRRGSGFCVLEVNMRLAATLRMSMLASGINVLSWLGQQALTPGIGKPKPGEKRYVCEFPVKPQYAAMSVKHVGSLDYITTTTRFTVHAASKCGLVHNVREVVGILGDTELLDRVKELT